MFNSAANKYFAHTYNLTFFYQDLKKAEKDLHKMEKQNGKATDEHVAPEVIDVIFLRLFTYSRIYLLVYVRFHLLSEH